MNVTLELHDSEVSAAQEAAGTLHLLFSAAYIHRSEGRPGINPGAGYVQPAELVFSGASWHGLSPECAGPLSNGTLTVDGKTLSLIPLPFSATGELNAEFVFVSGAILSVLAKSVACSCSGEPHFVETYGD